MSSQRRFHFVSAPSAVVTPATTLIDGGDLTADQVAAALGLVDDSGV